MVPGIWEVPSVRDFPRQRERKRRGGPSRPRGLTLTSSERIFLNFVFSHWVKIDVIVRLDPRGHDRPPLLSLPLVGEVPNGRSLPDPGDQ